MKVKIVKVNYPGGFTKYQVFRFREDSLCGTFKEMVVECDTRKEADAFVNQMRQPVTTVVWEGYV